MPDIGGIASGIVEAISDGVSTVASSAGDEFKKAGQSTISQVTGNSVGSHSTSEPHSLKSAANNLGNGTANSGDDASGDYSVWGEFKKLGKSASGQVSGNDDNAGADSLNAMTKKDENFSSVEYANVRAKVQQIYAEYEAKKKKQEIAQKQQGEVVEEQKKEIEEIKEERKKDDFVNSAIEKSRAEIKNYGAE